MYNSNFTVNTSQNKHIKYSKGIPNNSKGSRRHQYYYYVSIVFFTIFADRPNIVQDATKTTKTCAIEQTNVGGLTSKRNGIEPSGESKNQTIANV